MDPLPVGYSRGIICPSKLKGLNDWEGKRRVFNNFSRFAWANNKEVRTLVYKFKIEEDGDTRTVALLDIGEKTRLTMGGKMQHVNPEQGKRQFIERVQFELRKR